MLRKAIALGAMSAVVAVCQRESRPLSTTRVNSEAPLSELVAINQAAIIYFSWLNRLPTSLKQLGPSGGKVADVNAADLITSDLASGSHNGYRFTLTATKAGWIVRAVPLSEARGDFETTYSIESRVAQRTTTKQ